MNQRFILALLGMLSLSACAGGENLYAGPLNSFQQAVAETGQTVEIYDGLERKLARASALSLGALSPDASVSFDDSACAAAKRASDCAVLDGAKQPIAALASKPSATLAMMRQIETYAALLSDIAGAVSAEELEAREKRSATALDQMQAGVKELKAGSGKRGLQDFKSAAGDALASAYLQSKRRKLLTTLVKDADPIIADAATKLGDVLGGVRTSYVETQALRIDLQVKNFNNLASLLKNAQGAVGKAEAEVLRRESLDRLLRDSTQLQAVMNTDPGEAFTAMAAAHGALLNALEFSGTGLGKAIEAIENFTAAAKRASNAYQTVQELM